MKNLAVDTSSSVCSVAIFEDNKLIDINVLDNGKTHSENLMPLLDELLSRNGIDIKEINLISVCVGPGSFTGIRIGVSAIKPIAEILGIKVASVTSLETLARNISDQCSTIVSLIDARNDQVYCGIFDSNYHKLEEYIADDINVAIDSISKYSDVICVGDGATLHKGLLIEKLGNIRFIDNNKQSAEMTGLCGFDKYQRGELVDADTVVPLYLRKSQAERQKSNG